MDKSTPPEELTCEKQWKPLIMITVEVCFVFLCVLKYRITKC